MIMAEILLTKNPTLATIPNYHSVQEHFGSLIDEATVFNIATGFITNDSIATLQQIVEYKRGGMRLNLFIGMNYLEGFTKIQYKAVESLNTYLTNKSLGNVYLSPQALYHGKMYSFYKNSKCLGGFIGSSNLGSFVGRDPSYIEADAYFQGDDGKCIDSRIRQIIDSIGVKLIDVPQISKFKDPELRLLDGYHYVKEVSNEQLAKIKSSRTHINADVPLKDTPKSNLNTYFGAGKIKGKYSPRGWYEVELIISKNAYVSEVLPTDAPFTIVTSDGYKFKCERQGTNFKNIRSCNDLKILGRWIKGRMENDGTLEIGKPVTQDVLNSFGHSGIRLTKTTILDEEGREIWYMSFV